MTDEAAQEFFASLTETVGTPPLTSDEAEEILDLARVVAHGHERRFAPLAAYVVGRSLGDELEPEARARRLREVRSAVERQVDG